jgi:hypothetical protein
MNILLCTSRGRSIEPLLKPITDNGIENRVAYFTGASINRLANEAESMLIDSNLRNPNTHFYVIAGIPDLTQKISDKNNQYEEVIFREQPEIAAQRVIRLYHRLIDRITTLNASVIICPIIPSSIKKWNFTRLHQKKTLYLEFPNYYSTWQTNLQMSITLANKQITEINRLNNLCTPFITRPVIKAIAADTKYKFSYFHLPDGVHLDYQLSQKVIKKLEPALEKKTDRKKINLRHPSPRLVTSWPHLPNGHSKIRCTI